MAIGVKEVTGSTGASASKASSVIVALEGTVHPAPLALFGESLSEYGFAPSKESEAPRVPNPLQSKRLTPMSCYEKWLINHQSIRSIDMDLQGSIGDFCTWGELK